ncbi:MAG: O-antigen ligase family protein [Chloroflexi bacterium]|nr:O-antigen ligase family protein [Chloroflexota bacterium]
MPPLPSMPLTHFLGYGLAAVPIVGAVVPLAIETGTASSIVAAFLLAAIVQSIWVLRFLVTRCVIVVQSPINVPSVLVGTVWILACLSSNVFFDPRVAVGLGSAFATVQLASVAVTLVSLGLALLAANIGQDRRYCRVATWSLIAVGCVAIVAHYAGADARLWFLNTNGLFTLWVVALAYGQALFNERLPALVRLGLVGLVGAFVFKVAVIQTAWLSGWMPALVAVGVVTLLRSRVLFGVGLLVAATLAVGFESQIYAAVVESQLGEGSDSRVDIWAQAWDLLSQHPLLGTGPAGYAAYYMTLYRSSGSSMSTHSNYADVLAQTGIVGALCFLWLLAALSTVAWQACRRWRHGFEGGFASAAAAGLAGALVAMFLGDWVIPFVYNQGIGGFRYTVHTWVFLGFMAALAQAPASSPTGPGEG